MKLGFWVNQVNYYDGLIVKCKRYPENSSMQQN